MNELEFRPLHAEARELAEASVADGDETRLASAAAAFLDAYGYEPGFEQAPGRFARLERALGAVRADMRATGLTGEVRLVRPGWAPGNAAVETWAGDQGWTGGISSSDAADDLSALVAVAEQARQAIMESLRYQSTGRAWPACPAHGLGTSPRARHGTGVWWCNGDDGHVSAEIGHWAAWQQSRLWRIPRPGCPWPDSASRAPPGGTPGEPFGYQQAARRGGQQEVRQRRTGTGRRRIGGPGI
jgi:hypothetical protein